MVDENQLLESGESSDGSRIAMNAFKRDIFISEEVFPHIKTLLNLPDEHWTRLEIVLERGKLVTVNGSLLPRKA